MRLRHFLEAPRLIRLICVELLLLGSLMLMGPAAGAQTPVTPHYAGLVIQHGDGSLTWAVVPFMGESISGVALLQQTGLSIVTVPFGALGAAVCQIEREGCPVPECQRTVCETSARSLFWRYYQRAPDGAWQSAALGASATKAHDGDVFAWSWGNGDLALAPATLADVARRAGLDPAHLAAIGRDGSASAVVRSGYGGRPDSGQQSLWLGVGGLAAILMAGTVLLGVQRRRLGRW